MNDLFSALVESVRAQLSGSVIIDEITEKLAQKKYRRVFLLFNNLKEDGKWVVDEVDERNLEAFWWEYATKVAR